VNSESARGGLAALNVALTAGLAFLGWFTFIKHHEPLPADAVPAYLPTKLQLPVNQKQADPLKEFAIVWQGLDKPLPPPAPPPPKEPPPPKIEDLESKFTLLLVAIDPEGNEKLNNCIIEAKQALPGMTEADKQQSFRVGDSLFPPFDGYKVVKIEAKGEKPRIAIMTLEDTKKTGANGEHPVSTIKLTPKEG
jgi:hypothetical protein